MADGFLIAALALLGLCFLFLVSILAVVVARMAWELVTEAWESGDTQRRIAVIPLFVLAAAVALALIGAVLKATGA